MRVLSTMLTIIQLIRNAKTEFSGGQSMGSNNAKWHLKEKTRSNVQINGLIGRKSRCFVALTVKTMSHMPKIRLKKSVKKLKSLMKTIQKG